MTEVWKDVSGFDGLYKVSNTGKVKRSFVNGKERILSGRKDKDGYIEVILSKAQHKSYFRIHRLVAKAFIPNPDGKPMVNHKDKNVQNNAVTNLEWVTASENVVHGYCTGRKVRKRPVVQYTKNMDFIAFWNSIREAGQALCINEHNINSCCNDKLPSAGGYIWRYQGVNI